MVGDNNGGAGKKDEQSKVTNGFGKDDWRKGGSALLKAEMANSENTKFSPFKPPAHPGNFPTSKNSMTTSVACGIRPPLDHTVQSIVDTVKKMDEGQTADADGLPTAEEQRTLKEETVVEALKKLYSDGPLKELLLEQPEGLKPA